MFKQLTVGALPVWESTTDEEINEELSRIQNSTQSTAAPEAILPEHIQAQLTTFMSAREQTGATVYAGMSKVLAAGGVDIILPVHNALHLVKACIKSVEENTTHPHRLIIVDDASDYKTQQWLEEYAKDRPDMYLLRNKKNRGFAATVNRGMREGWNPFIILLNSDVLVTPGWLIKMVMAIEDNPRNMFVNPVTNNTAMIAVPMKEGASYLDMNRAIEITTRRTYPEIMPTGFALMFRRSLLKDIGYIDEGYGSYGEESDYWMKAVKHISEKDGSYPRYRAVLADNTYLFHERGGSFNEKGDEHHLKQRSAGAERFHKLHPEFRTVWSPSHVPNMNKELKRIQEMIDSSVLYNPANKYNIAWVVASSAYCGGMKYISDVVNELQQRGINAKVVQLLRDPLARKINTLNELHTSPVIYRTAKDLVTNFSRDVFDSGIVVASTAELAVPVLKLFQDHPELVPLNHIQSYDVDLAGDLKSKKKLLEVYETCPKQISNAGWIANKVKSIGAPGEIPVVHPGIEHDIYYPRDREDGDDRPTILIHMNPQYPFKGYQRGVEVCKKLLEISEEQKEELRILAVGVDSVPEVPTVVGIGAVPATRMGLVLGTEVDISFDPSELHSYGLPILEAMASNVASASWDNDGLREYANAENCLIFPHDMTYENVAYELWDLLKDDKRRARLAREGVATARSHDRKKSVNQFIDAMEGLMMDKSVQKKKICIVTPHVRKHGGPTTLVDTANLLAAHGHDVSVCSIYKDSINQNLIESCKVPLFFGPEHIPACDILFVPSDSDHHGMLHDLPQVKKRILFKLGHNPRFKVLEEEGLHRDYDAIVTSTQWLKEACETPTEGWTYPIRPANRVGWYNYAFPQFNSSPSERLYNKFKGATRVILGGLIHNHPLKGSKELVAVFKALQKKHPQWLLLTGIGEAPLGDKPDWFIYHEKLNRESLSKYFGQVDIWVGCSHSEGLGRMALEAMSAGCACILSDTGAEFVKHGSNALVYDVGDAQKCAEAVESLLLDTDLFTKIITGGYNTASQLADPTQYVTNLENVIQEVSSK